MANLSSEQIFKTLKELKNYFNGKLDSIKLTDEENAKLDSIIVNGTGLKFLSDDGTYKEIDVSNLLTKETFDADGDGIIDSANVANQLKNQEKAPLFSYYGKNKDGEIGFHEFPISAIKDDLNNYSSIIQNAKANNVYTIDLREAKDDYAIVCQAYEFIEGQDDTTSLVKTFNNAQKYNFKCDEENVSFEDGMQINKNHKLNMTLNADGFMESETIKKSDFIEIGGLK